VLAKAGGPRSDWSLLVLEQPQEPAALLETRSGRLDDAASNRFELHRKSLAANIDSNGLLPLRNGKPGPGRLVSAAALRQVGEELQACRR